MNDIEAAFAKYFGDSDIRLPEDATAQKQPGTITTRRWIITYVFGEDYLDFYAVSRWTNPCHVRIHSNGRIEELEAPREMYGYPHDADESAKRQAEEEFYAHNRRVYAELKAKGLTDY